MARLRRSLDEDNHTSVSDEMLDGAQNLTQVAQDDEPCAMDCRNGGECRLGRAVHGFSADLLEDVSTCIGNESFVVSTSCISP
jgi:hypothetical protein